MAPDLLRTLMARAKENLRASGNLLPVLYVAGKGEALVGIGEMPRTAEERQALFYLLGRRFAELRPNRVAAVMDAYMKVDDAGLELPLKRSLADDPAAVECIVVASLDRKGKSRILICPYERRPMLEGLEIEFLPVREPAGEGELYLLQAFFDGVKGR